MNERIEALKKLSTKEVWGDNPPADCPEFDGYELDADMFAQLIVQECAQVSEDDITDGDACCTNTAVRISRQIKKHFGVEE